MALFVNTNVAALNGQKNLNDVTARMNSSFEKLSSGSRINSAKDDAAGLQISDRLTTQVIGLEQATRNANDGISIAQIAEGALGEMTNNIQRMRQLAVQGGNRTLSSDDREALGQEFEKLLNVNNGIANRTAFGTQKILNSESPETGFQIQTGAYAGEQDSITTGNAELTALFGKVAVDESGVGALSLITNATASDLGAMGTAGKLIAGYMMVNDVSAVSLAAAALFTPVEGNVSELGTTAAAEVNVSSLVTILTKETVASAANSSEIATILVSANITGLSSELTTVSNWSGEELNTVHGFATDVLLDSMSGLITQVDKQRAKLGAEQNGLTSVVRNNTTAVVNVSDSRSRIQDTDFAAETAELTRNQIIQQASTTILSQANQLPQTALTLLG
ncbi:flagellin [Oceanospirillum sanctuarii]|uniref:flagellin N-terminal helical domain-containing protein n=1 Tax=Oceanospirillum sanctuarii TaxID=1434821 RepID=UPI000A360CF9|nr:flagellin [Oceanospirillum sanctuarii]